MIDFNLFFDWIQERFADHRCKGDEIKINSIFAPDTKRHLYCNPAKNAYHCWKTGESGNLVQLVSLVDGVDMATAAQTVGADNHVRTYDKRLEEFFSKKKASTPPPSIKLPENTFKINDLSDLSKNKRDCVKYLSSRKIPTDGMMVCTAGKYSNRIIIPYYGKHKELIYWNGRALGYGPRYLGPDRDEVKVGKEDVVYFYEWPKPGSTVYLTEGEFDSISLCLSGLGSAAVGGKEVFDKQMEMLREYRVCLSFDGDERGREALHNVGIKLLRNGFSITFVQPPSQFKDWNQMLVGRGDCVEAYIKKYQKPFDSLTIL